MKQRDHDKNSYSLLESNNRSHLKERVCHAILATNNQRIRLKSLLIRLSIQQDKMFQEHRFSREE